MELNINTITLKKIFFFYWTLNKCFIITFVFIIGLDVNAQYQVHFHAYEVQQQVLLKAGELFQGKLSICQKTWKLLETHLANGIIVAPRMVSSWCFKVQRQFR